MSNYKYGTLTINSALEIPEVLKRQAESLKMPDKKYNLPFSIKNQIDLEKISRNIRGNDDLRPQMGFVYCFGEKMAFLDAHKLFLIPIKENFKGIIDPKGDFTNKQAYESTPSNWQIDEKKDFDEHPFNQVFPDYDEANYSGVVDLHALYLYCEFVKMNFVDVFSKIYAPNPNVLFNVTPKFESDSVGLNIDSLIDCISVFMNLGINQVHLYNSTPSRPLLFTANKLSGEKSTKSDKFIKGNVICLFMPVMIETNGNAFSNFNFDIEFNLFYNLSTNRITDKNGVEQDIFLPQSILSVNEFQYTYKQFKKNANEIKKIINEVVKEDSFRDIYRHFMYQFDSVEESQITLEQKKMIFALNWWRNFSNF